MIITISNNVVIWLNYGFTSVICVATLEQVVTANKHVLLLGCSVSLEVSGQPYKYLCAIQS